MRYIVENDCDLRDFPFWSGAQQTADIINEMPHGELIWDDLEHIICGFGDSDERELTDTEINDYVWFEALEQIIVWAREGDLPQEDVQYLVDNGYVRKEDVELDEEEED